jgi:hypothetical protein
MPSEAQIEKSPTAGLFSFVVGDVLNRSRSNGVEGTNKR